MSHANQQPHRFDDYYQRKGIDPSLLTPSNSSSSSSSMIDDPMTPSSSATPRRRWRRRNPNASVPVPAPVRGSAAASARALAAGLWRLRHARSMKTAGAPTQAPSPQKKPQGRRRRASRHHLCGCCCCHSHGNKGHYCQCQCTTSTTRNNRAILDKIEACCVEQLPSNLTMEKATKWDANNHHHHLALEEANHHHDHHHHLCRSTTSPSPLLLVMEAELEKARAHISELEDERRVMTKRLERFLRTLAEDKARIRDKARHAAAALREERAHRRQLEAANAKLMRELGEARSSAKQQAQSYEMERKARELMEEACSELTREVEEDQAEVELLRRECLRMREEMEEERRMLQMAEVWREERVQMKLSDAKLALESKYSQLNQLQAEMEAFLMRTKQQDASSASAMRDARIISDAAAAAAASSSVRSRSRSHSHHRDDHARISSGDSAVDADSVLEHFRRKESNLSNANDPPSPCDSNLLSPATDLFLAKVDAGSGSSADMEYDGGRDSCSWFGTSDRSASAGNGSAVTTAERRRSVGKNTALIRRLWRAAITESRNRTTAGWSPSSDRRSSSVTAEAPPAAAAAAAEQRSWSGSVNLPMRKHDGDGQKQSKQSLREKLMEARMDDHKPVKHRT